MNQISLLPTILVDEQPPPPNTSKDLLWIGFDEKGSRYAFKTSEPQHPILPLIEWLCYHLCSLAGIATPHFAIVQRVDGSLAFGSLWEEQAQQFNPSKISEVQMTTWLQRASSDVSAMFALDAFMPNPDRHLANILFVQIGPRLRALAFDWSRTHLFSPWPWAQGCNSTQVWQWLKHSALVQPQATQAHMQRIASITPEQVKNILLAAPQEWRNNLDCEATAQWWGTQAHQRSQDALALLLP